MTLLEAQNDNLTCAALLIDTVPLIMRAIGAEMRSHRPSDLSVQQFRALLFIRRNPGTSLARVAEHTGLTTPTTSKMVDRLVARGLISRQVLARNRRRVTLGLTNLGEATLSAAHDATQNRLAELLAPLPQPTRDTIARALCALQPLFTPGPEPGPNTSARNDHA
jgi:DNA-binding MarR family transcriptional regulator